MQTDLFKRGPAAPGPPPVGKQLLKWIGNKQRFAAEIVGHLPQGFGTYFEPFVGSAAVLANLGPERAEASDVLAPLVGIYRRLQDDPEGLVAGYAERWTAFMEGARKPEYLALRARYNAAPNPDDLLFLVRSCYGGVVRFNKSGGMNTPCGAHRPISPAAFAERVALWRPRLAGVDFSVRDFEDAIDRAGPGDLVYCDPPYQDSASTIYGAQGFALQRLYTAIERARGRGARVALSIDGTKRSGRRVVDLDLPPGLFRTELLIRCGRSMLRRFQMEGETLQDEVVADRLLLTWSSQGSRR